MFNVKKIGLICSFVFFSGLTETRSIAKNITNKDIIANAYLGDGITDQLFASVASRGQKDCFVNNTYASYYFKNLRENFGNNVYGSCGYVGLGMLLSFYDAYWNNSVVPNDYDVNSTYIPKDNTNLVPIDATSPGTNFELGSMFEGMDINEYFNYAIENKESSFQFKLFDLAKEYFGESKFNSSTVNLGLNSSDLYYFLDYYLFNYRNFDKKKDLSIKFSTPQIYGEAKMKQEIVDGIKKGSPSLLIVKNQDSSRSHVVVAYDYDSSKSQFYVHTGWRNEHTGESLTHVSLSDIGCEDIVCYCQLEIPDSKSKNMGLKYFAKNTNRGVNAEIFLFPQDIKLKSGNYVDMQPVFTWKSLADERWELDKSPYFRISVLDAYSKEVYQTTEKITSREYRLDKSAWERVCCNNPVNAYYICLELTSDIYPYWDEYICKTRFNTPKDYTYKKYIDPSEYGFSDAYPTDFDTSNRYTKHTVRNIKFETRRYRVGYIHNESVVMSPIRKNIDLAYIEYRFQTALTRIDVEMSHWREESKELLNKSNGKAVIQTFMNDKWVDVVDLLSDETRLPRNRNNKMLLKVEFPQPTYLIRFYANYNLPCSVESNKGRICIGRMALYESSYRLPLSGYEIKYEPDVWNNTVTSQFLFIKWYLKEYTNCYSYAVNAQVNPTTNSLLTMQPGQSTGTQLYANDMVDTDKVLSAIKRDANNLGFGFDENNGNTPCPAGTYRVAFVIDNDGPYYDYHWYRQNKDGSWSHKPRTTDVTNKDYDGNIIMDPKTCNRKADSCYNYNLFVGYYSVKPLNTRFNG